VNEVDYSANPNQRTPCVLVLDASTSMEARPYSGGKKAIEALNEGLRALEEHLREDDTALTRVQLAIVSVGGPAGDADILMDWTDAINFEAFELQAGGATPLGKGIRIALDLVEDGKDRLRSEGISYTRPWMMVISDGMPTDTEIWEKATADCRQAEADKKVEIFTIGVKDAHFDTLAEISAKEPVMLQGIKFSELFVWLSNSLGVFSRSRPGEEVQLPSTDPWRNVRV
jgi:uncharacterized protein YegL